MDRDKAIEVIKQVYTRCSSLEGKSITLIPIKTGMKAEGYQIHIQTRNDTYLESCIEGIAEKNKLTLIKEGDGLKICEP